MFCRCRGVVEWFVSLVFDVILLIVEASVNLYLANTLGEEGLTLEYRAIIIMIMLPSLVNPCVWLGLKSSYNISRYLYFHMYLVCSEKKCPYLSYLGSEQETRRAPRQRTRKNLVCWGNTEITPLRKLLHPYKKEITPLFSFS